MSTGYYSQEKVNARRRAVILKALGAQDESLMALTQGAGLSLYVLPKALQKLEAEGLARRYNRTIKVGRRKPFEIEYYALVKGNGGAA